MNSFFSPLPNYQLIAVTGDKAATFLQGQITCDVRDINPTQTRRGAHCSPKGRVLFTFRVLEFQTRLYLLVPTVMTDTLLTQLKKYAVFSQVTLKVDEALKVMGCVGTDISDTLVELFGDVPIDADQAIDKNDGLLIRVQNENTAPRFEVIATTNAMMQLQQTLQKKHAEKTAEQWQRSEINAAIPTIYPQTANLFTPQMLNYPALNGVSFKKGCYTGQEVIARTHYLGKAKRHLHRLSMTSTTPLVPGDALTNEKQEVVGIIIDAALQEADEYQLLAVVQDDALLLRHCEERFLRRGNPGKNS